MLVIRGSDDAVFSAAQAEHTAAFYGADMAVVPHSGHDLMLEANWHQAAHRIESWLMGKRLVDPASLS